MKAGVLSSIFSSIIFRFFNTALLYPLPHSRRHGLMLKSRFAMTLDEKKENVGGSSGATNENAHFVGFPDACTHLLLYTAVHHVLVYKYDVICMTRKALWQGVSVNHLAAVTQQLLC